MVPARIYSGATGAGRRASISFMSSEPGHRPFLLTAQADPERVKLAEPPNEVYIFELFAIAASVFHLRGELFGRQVILVVYNEAA